jgi:hypothetical protein
MGDFLLFINKVGGEEVESWMLNVESQRDNL